MTAEIVPETRRARDPAVFLAVIALAIGLFFRFDHLERKVYSGDEVYTTLRMLGTAEADLVRQAPSFHDVGDLRRVLHPVPAQGTRGPFAPAATLAAEEPQHPPLYFTLGHFWLGLFGNSAGAIRALSALLSLAGLPLAFALGAELYGTRRAGWIALALYSLSPVGIVYAQEAREYSLWSVALLALDLAVLRALRRDRAFDWILTATLTAFALYVYPLSLLVVAGLAAYVAATRWDDRTVVLHGLGALGAGILAAMPWLVVIAVHWNAVNRGIATILETRLSILEIGRGAAAALRLNVFDLNFVHSSTAGALLTGIALVGLAGALAFVTGRTAPRVWLFLLLPILASSLPLLCLDLFGGQRVRSPRYFIPAYLSFDFALAGFFTIATGLRNVRGYAYGYAALVALLAVRAYSSFASWGAETWWNKMQDNSIAVARAVNAAKSPLLVSDNILDYSLVLSGYLRPDVALALRPRCYLCSGAAAPRLDDDVLPNRPITDVYALGPSSELQKRLHELIARRGHGIAYHCINARHNCASDLNVEPIFDAPVPHPAADSGT